MNSLRAAWHATFSMVMLLCLLSFSANAEEAPSLREINRLLGLDQAMDNISASFAKIPDEMAAGIPEAMSKTWRQISPTVFKASEIIADIERKVDGKLAATDRRSLYEFANSDFGRKVASLEVAASGRDRSLEEDAAKRVIEELEADDPERLNLYREMVDAVNAVDMTEAMALNVAYALSAAMMAEAKVNMSEADLMAAMRRNMGDLRGKLENSIIADAAATYRSMTIEEIADYNRFLQTSSARRYYDASFSALSDSITERAKRFGRELVTALRERKA